MEGFDLTALASELGALITQWGLRAVGAVAVLVIGRMAARRIRSGFTTVLERRGTDRTLVQFGAGLLYWGVLAFVIIAVLGLFGIPTASFVAVLGAAGLAVGLALQGTLSNFAAGVMLLAFRPFRAGDFISAAGADGVVEEIGIFSVTLTTPDGIRVIVPNAEVYGGVIRNLTGNPRRRVDLLIGVGYDDDLGVARDTIRETLASCPGILEDPEPMVAVQELGDSSVNFMAQGWCETSEYWTVRREATHRIKEALDAAGCSIPFPQRDVHLYSTEASAA